MSKTEFESQLDVQSNFSDSFPPLKNEQQILTEAFRRRYAPTDRPCVERIFGELNDGFLSSMDAVK